MQCRNISQGIFACICSEAGCKDPSARKEGAKEGVEGEAEAPPPDNRTWLQKNWIYMVPVIFMVRLVTGSSPSTQWCCQSSEGDQKGIISAGA